MKFMILCQAKDLYTRMGVDVYILSQANNLLKLNDLCVIFSEL